MTVEKIVQDPNNRLDWWVMKTFNVLPTSEEFMNLTGMQKEFIYQNYLEDNPKLKSKIQNVQYDDDFNEEWDKLAPKEGSEGSEDAIEEDYGEDDEILAELAQKAYSELQDNEDTAMEPARERLKKYSLKTADVDDWEEVDE